MIDAIAGAFGLWTVWTTRVKSVFAVTVRSWTWTLCEKKKDSHRVEKNQSHTQHTHTHTHL